MKRIVHACAILCAIALALSSGRAAAQGSGPIKMRIEGPGGQISPIAVSGLKNLGGAHIELAAPADHGLVEEILSGSRLELAERVRERGDLLRRGVHELDTVMNTGKLISRQFQYLETELQQMADSCHQSGATLTVNLESEFLNEELKILACRVARRAGADYIGTNSLTDVPFLLSHSRERLKIKSCGQIHDLAAALAFRDLAEVSVPPLPHLTSSCRSLPAVSP